MSELIKNRFTLIFEKNNNYLLNELLNTIIDGFISYSKEKQIFIIKDELLDYFKSKENIVIESTSGCTYSFTKGNKKGQKCGKKFVEIADELLDEFPNIHYCYDCVRKVRPKKELEQKGVKWSNLISYLDENKPKRSNKNNKNVKKSVSEKGQTNYQIEKFPSGQNTENTYTVTCTNSKSHYIANRTNEEDKLSTFIIMKKKKNGQTCNLLKSESDKLTRDGFQIDKSLIDNIIEEESDSITSGESGDTNDSESEENLDMFESQSDNYSSSDE